MSHYIKAVLDGVFGKGNFRNEIVWWYRRWPAKGRHFQRMHDVVLRYTASHEFTWCQQYDELSESSVRMWKEQRRVDVVGETGRRYSVTDTEESPGVPMRDVWEIPVVHPASKERQGYPTQKPLALLDRIIRTSSNEGDVVLDPFCGCGTTIHAAQNLGRRWIGIDICVNACKVIERRLRGHFDSLWSEIEFIGFPKTVDHAKTLAGLDKFRFERWAAALVDGMEPNHKQRGDKGIDGWGRIPIRKG